MTIDADLAPDRLAGLGHTLDRFSRQQLESTFPILALHRETLRNGSALRQHAVEVGVMPAYGKIDRTVKKRVAIDQPGERGERQVGAIDRMREQKRVTRRRLDGPEAVEFDDEAIVIEERRSDNLTGIVKSDRGKRIFADEILWQIEIPVELAIANFETVANGMRNP